ncbi:MAG: hypothetical protein DRJ03_09305, partial [Chloroflexi bacterium]
TMVRAWFCVVVSKWFEVVERGLFWACFWRWGFFRVSSFLLVRFEVFASETAFFGEIREFWACFRSVEVVVRSKFVRMRVNSHDVLGRAWFEVGKFEVRSRALKTKFVRWRTYSKGLKLLRSRRFRLCKLQT